MKGGTSLSKYVLYILIFLLALTGCSSKDNEVANKQVVQIPADEIKIVASEKSWPDTFHEISFQREESPHFNYLVKMADNQVSFEEEWKLFNMSKEMPKIDFETKDAIFLGFTESGSCPYLKEDINLKLDTDNMTVQLLEHNVPCTMDETPRAIIIEVSKESSKDLQTVTIEESNIKTSIPIEES